MGFGVGVMIGWGLVTCSSGWDCFSLVKTIASVIMIASTITVTTTTTAISRRLFGLKGMRTHSSQLYTF